MTQEELKLRRLAGQHLLAPEDTGTVVRDLCGVQAQFLGHALHGLRIRCPEVSTDGLVKGWTNRGTMHLFCAGDLPLFLHEGRTHFLRPVDTMASDAHVTAVRKAYFAERILDAVARDIGERESLRVICRQAGMTEGEEQSLFDPWGGLIRALCEEGRICHKVQEKKAYQLCPAFVPMEERTARLELARRYFTHFGPATVKDAAGFFGTTQARVKSWLKELPVSEMVLEGKQYYSIGGCLPGNGIPGCIFLAGFDQLLMGYEKTQNPFLPPERMREVFTRAGIVRPTILVDGTVAGWWNLKNRSLKLTLFSPVDRKRISDAAEGLWGDLRQVEYLE